MRIENTGVHHYYASKWKKETDVNIPEAKVRVTENDELKTLQKEAKGMADFLQQNHFEDVVREDKLREIKEKMDNK